MAAATPILAASATAAAPCRRGLPFQAAPQAGQHAPAAQRGSPCPADRNISPRRQFSEPEQHTHQQDNAYNQPLHHVSPLCQPVSQRVAWYVTNAAT